MPLALLPALGFVLEQGWSNIHKQATLSPAFSGIIKSLLKETGYKPMEQPSSLPKKKELFLIASILVLALAISLIFYMIQQASAGHTVARIVIDGVEVETIDLTTAEDQTIDLQPLWGVPVILEVKNHQIRFASSDCPDQICVNDGFIDTELQMAVCMPNRTVVAIDSDHQ